MSDRLDWLPDELVDGLLAATRPHPTIAAADLAEFKLALDDLSSNVRSNLRSFDATRHCGGIFADRHRVWQERNRTMVALRVLLNDATMRGANVDLTEMWRQLVAVRNCLIQHSRIKVVA